MKDQPASLSQSLSLVVVDLVDPKPDPSWRIPAESGSNNKQKWASMVKKLKYMQWGAEDRVLGLETTPHDDDDNVSLTESLTDSLVGAAEHCREKISGAMNEALHPQPDPVYRDDESMIDRFVDQTVDDDRSLASVATMVMDQVKEEATVIYEEVVDPKPTGNPNWAAPTFCASCFG